MPKGQRRQSKGASTRQIFWAPKKKIMTAMDYNNLKKKSASLQETGAGNRGVKKGN